MNSARIAGTKLLLAAAAIVAFAVVWPTGEAQADIDLTGTWNFFFVEPIIGFECLDAQVVQTDSDVDMDCGGFVVTFDKATRTLSGFHCPPVPIGCAGFSGTVSPDGDSVTGIWRLSNIAAEFPFSGTRKDTVTPPPVGGIAIDRELSALASDTAEASGNDEPATVLLFAAATCGIILLGGGAWLVARRRVPWPLRTGD